MEFMIASFLENKKQEYIEQGISPEEASIKVRHWINRHTQKQKDILKHQGVKYAYVDHVPYIDTGSEKWYIDIDYQTNKCYLFHNTINTEQYHFQKAFKKGNSVNKNVIEICHYIRDHSFQHIYKDFTNTLKDKLGNINFKEMIFMK